MTSSWRSCWARNNPPGRRADPSRSATHARGFDPCGFAGDLDARASHGEGFTRELHERTARVDCTRDLRRADARSSGCTPAQGHEMGHEASPARRRSRREDAKRQPPRELGAAGGCLHGLRVRGDHSAFGASAPFLRSSAAYAVRLSALRRRFERRPLTCGPSSLPTSCRMQRSVWSPTRRLSSLTMRV